MHSEADNSLTAKFGGPAQWRRHHSLAAFLNRVGSRLRVGVHTIRLEISPWLTGLKPRTSRLRVTPMFNLVEFIFEPLGNLLVLVVVDV